MRRRFVLLLVLCLVVLVALPAAAGGRNNTTYVKYDRPGGFTCETFWKTAGSGLMHEWRDDPRCSPIAGEYSLHIVFKPDGRKWSEPDCDAGPDLLAAVTQWTFLGGHTDYPNGEVDDADLTQLLTVGDSYHLCIYRW